MTTVKSRLLTPDSEPVVGRKITATLMSRPSWVADKNRARALGTVTTYTDHTGCWRMQLMPYNQFEGGGEKPYVWYRIDEGEGAVWSARFDDSKAEVWLYDCLIDKPNPDPQWVAIDKLSRLHDVDNDVANAPEGSVLVKRNGFWTAELPDFGAQQLAQLEDVDAASVADATAEDYLQYLGHGWGVIKQDDPTPTPNLDGLFTKSPDDASGYTTRLTITARLDDKQVVVDWGDESDTTTLEPGTDTADHRYEWADTFVPRATYVDGTDGSIEGWEEIPYDTARTKTMTDTDTPTPKPVPTLAVTPERNRERGVVARLMGYTGSTYLLFWGDDTSEVATSNSNITKKDGYAHAGAFTLTARERGTGTIIATTQVVVRDGLTPDGVTFTPDPDDPTTIVATFSEVEPVDILPKVYIDWGDGADPDEVWAVPGTSISRTLEPGTYTRMVRDLGTKRSVRESYTVTAAGAAFDPDGEFAKSPDDASGMTARFTFTAVEDKPVIVDWGDPSIDLVEIAKPTVGSHVDGAFDFPDVYLPRVYYKDGSGKPLTSGVIEVPYA